MLKKVSPSGTAGANSSQGHNTSDTIDFDRLKSDLLLHAETIVRELLPDGKRSGRNWQARNPRRADDDKAGSFSVNLDTGIWKDFARDDIKGGDLVSLWAYVRDVRQGDAARELSGRYGLNKWAPTATATARTPNRSENPNDAWEPLLVVPSNAPKPVFEHPHLGPASHIYEYVHADGMDSFYILRWDKPKDFRPLSLWRHRITGKLDWQWRALPSGRTLFKVHTLSMYPDAVVILTEGEKACKAASAIFPYPAYAPVCWSNGAAAIEQTDFSVLKNRRIWLWPDEDDPGHRAMRSLATTLQMQGAAELLMIRNEAFADCPSTRKPIGALPKGFDAADAVDAGWTHDLYLQELSNREFWQPWNQNAARTAAEPVSDKKKKSTSPFTVDELGVWYNPAEPDKERVWICSRLDVIAMARDERSQNWGRLIELVDSDGALHRWCMPMEMFRGSGEDYRGELLKLGLEINPGRTARDHLTTYIQTSRPWKRARCVSKTGWHMN